MASMLVGVQDTGRSYTAVQMTDIALAIGYFLCRTNSSADIERRISHLRWVLGTYRHGMNPRTLELLMIMQDDHDLTDRIHLTEAAYALLQQQKSISA